MGGGFRIQKVKSRDTSSAPVSGDWVFMRFLPDEIDEEIDEEEDEIVRDTLSCLKRIEYCEGETDRSSTREMREQIYDAWEVARGRHLPSVAKSKQTHSTYSRILGNYSVR